MGLWRQCLSPASRLRGDGDWRATRDRAGRRFPEPVETPYPPDRQRCARLSDLSSKGRLSEGSRSVHKRPNVQPLARILLRHAGLDPASSRRVSTRRETPWCAHRFFRNADPALPGSGSSPQRRHHVHKRTTQILQSQYLGKIPALFHPRFRATCHTGRRLPPHRMSRVHGTPGRREAVSFSRESFRTSA